MTYTPRPLLRVVPYGSPEYHALHRELYRAPRRRDALDCERGPMPDDDAQDEPYEPSWCAWVPMAVAAVVSEQRSPHAATAWVQPRLGDAARVTGLSRERMRQLRRHVETGVEDRIEDALTPLDREAIGAPPRDADWWDRADWLRVVRVAVADYRWEVHGGLDRRRRKARGT